MLSRMGGSLNLRRLKFKAVREYYTTVKESFRSTDIVICNINNDKVGAKFLARNGYNPEIDLGAALL